MILIVLLSCRIDPMNARVFSFTKLRDALAALPRCPRLVWKLEWNLDAKKTGAFERRILVRARDK